MNLPGKKLTRGEARSTSTRHIVSDGEQHTKELHEKMVRTNKGTLKVEPIDETRPERKRKIPSRFVESDNDEAMNKRKLSNRSTGKILNKWTAFKNKICSLGRSIARDQHYLNLYDADSFEVPHSHKDVIPERELLKCQARIRQAKESILSLFAAIEEENKGHRRWPQLKSEGTAEDDNEDDGDGSVEVEDVMCSRCGEPDEDDNDILFCDKAGCCRAYHQRCLDPPIEDTSILGGAEQDWFCWECNCIDECLDFLGETLDDDHDNWRELFPELRAAEHSQGSCGAGAKDDYDSEDDSDYDPSQASAAEELSQAPEQEDENSAGSSRGESASGSEDGDSVNSEDDYDESEGDSDSDIGDEEIKGLLQDADISVGIDPTNATGRALRPRRSKNEESWSVEGLADVGKLIATVQKGVMKVAKVVAFRYADAIPENVSVVCSTIHCSSSSQEPNRNQTSETGPTKEEEKEEECCWHNTDAVKAAETTESDVELERGIWTAQLVEMSTGTVLNGISDANAACCVGGSSWEFGYQELRYVDTMLTA
jgi:hypothetical protein